MSTRSANLSPYQGSKVRGSKVRGSKRPRVRQIRQVPPRRRVMKRTTILSTTVLLMAMFVAADAQAPTPFKRTVLQQGDLSAPGREAVMALAEIQPGAASGRHTHPGEEIAYVQTGPMILEIDGKPARTLQTGEVFMIP